VSPLELPTDVELVADDLAAADRLREAAQRILAECSKVIVGQKDVLEQLLIALFAQGHCLLVGVPGLAKTLMIRTLADAMDLTFARIQFTPDLMPSDITGTDILQEDPGTGHRTFQFLRGPLFAHVVLADEINRTPPKTQAALLEAMQEKQVTVGGNKHRLPNPFFVLATQNPIEQEGTYPLPEAQQDRFMFNVKVDYPNEADEYRIVETTTRRHRPTIDRVVTADELLAMQAVVLQVPAAEPIIRYAMRLTRKTRPDADDAPDYVRNYVTWGAGPRASQFLVLAGKARALLYGRPYVATEDIRAVAAPVLRHRLITNFNAEADGMKPDDIVKRLIEGTAVER
jgi:MoxR-like ATPase